MSVVRPLSLDDVPELVELHRTNREFLAPWEPDRDEHFFTADGQRSAVTDSLEVSEHANGRGIATAAVREMTALAFDDLGLHRVEAATLTHNVRSQRVLEQSGFVRFGLAPTYLMIAGSWQDHVLFHLLNPRWTAPRVEAPAPAPPLAPTLVDGTPRRVG